MIEKGHDITARPAVKAADATVLQVLPALEAGGVERGTVEIAAALTARGGRALVASAGGAMTRDIARAGATHIELPLTTKNPLAIFANAGRLARLIRAEGVDLVHARSRAPGWSALLAARRTGRPLVTTYHSPYGNSWLKQPYNSVMAKGDKVIAISDYVAEIIRRRHKIDEKRLVRIHRGVDMAVFSPEKVTAARMAQLAKAWRLPDDRLVLMLPGRLSRWKGHLTLLDALARLGRRDFVCLLVGATRGRERYQAELEEAVERHGLGRVVRLVDYCRDMAAAYMLADIVISASLQPEGFGRVAAEAQAMGKPVIATDHGGSREIVLPGETGWLVPPGAAGPLADAIGEAMELNTETREAVAYAARQRVLRHFTAERMCAQTLAVYDDLLGRE